jgi:hypothetical protein
MAAALESDSSPTSSPALVLAVMSASVTHPRSMSSRFLREPGPMARRLACRRRALEAVESVVTAREPVSIVTRDNSLLPTQPAV